MTNHVGSFPWTKGVEMIDGELPIMRLILSPVDQTEQVEAQHSGVMLKKVGVVKPSFSHTAMLEIHIYDGEAIPSAITYTRDRYEAVYD